MKDVSAMPEFRANLPRTSHNLSYDFGFTCTTAHLLPVHHDLLNPGEKVKIGFDFNLRTMPLEAAAFGDIVCHTEYFFVPMPMIYQPFENVFYDINQQFSSNFMSGTSVVTFNSLPLLDINKLCSDVLFDNGSAVVYPNTTLSAESSRQQAVRLLDMLGFCPLPAAGVESSGEGVQFYNPNVFPYQICAYHTIYQYYYRLDSREVFRPTFSNIDRYYSSSIINSTASATSFEWLRLHYRPLRNDYFTDVKVSPIVDVLNLNQKSALPLADSWLSRSNITSGSASVVLSSGGVGTSSFPPSVLNNPSATIQTNSSFQGCDISYPNANGLDINTANIRAMFANEKLWSITGRAKKTYDDQTLAHFGFKVPHDVKHEITCFGHDVTKIHIGEVISTASTENAPLGEIAGKGYGVQSGQRHEFTAPCHGVLMVIFSAEILRNYENGILRANAVANVNDLYHPEYDHLGMQPLFGYETSYLPDGDSYPITEIVGWQYRYEQWKRRYNRATGAFRNSTGSLKSWLPTFEPYGANTAVNDSGKFDNKANESSYLNFCNFPTDVNQIFLSQYPTTWNELWSEESTWSGMYDYDPFVVNSHIDCIKVSTMSDYSLPRLDA